MSRTKANILWTATVAMVTCVMMEVVMSEAHPSVRVAVVGLWAAALTGLLAFAYKKGL